MVSGDDVDDGDAVGIIASDIDDDVAAREKVTTRCGDDVAGANAIVIIGTARRRSRNDHTVNIFILVTPHFPEILFSPMKMMLLLLTVMAPITFATCQDH
jgi:hypothetical protein